MTTLRIQHSGPNLDLQGEGFSILHDPETLFAEAFTGITEAAALPYLQPILLHPGWVLRHAPVQYAVPDQGIWNLPPGDRPTFDHVQTVLTLTYTALPAADATSRRSRTAKLRGYCWYTHDDETLGVLLYLRASIPFYRTPTLTVLDLDDIAAVFDGRLSIRPLASK
jgi:hypothetical protein